MVKTLRWGIPVTLLSLAGCCAVPKDGAAVTDAEIMAPPHAVHAEETAVSINGGARLLKKSLPAAAANRQVAFAVELTISAPDVPAALRAASEIAKKHDGYASEIGDQFSILKIPVRNVSAALIELEVLGKVESRHISAEDVTENAIDLDLRISNLESLHRRLTELVEKAAGVRDILAVEKELSRVTGELERLRSMRKNLGRRVDFATIRLNFTPPSSVEVETRRLIPPHIAGLGLCSTELRIDNRKAADPPFEFNLPQGFVPVSMRESNGFFAVDDRDTVIAASILEPLPGADLRFWSSMISRALRELHGYTVTSEQKTASNGTEYALIRGRRLRGTHPIRYEISCRITRHCFRPDEVYIIEVIGSEERMMQLDSEPLHRDAE